MVNEYFLFHNQLEIKGYIIPRSWGARNISNKEIEVEFNYLY